ncbi:AbrB/MazE/SpoVT family DNA-binding domain-containing protein [Natrinema salsiterrestre]|uniref:AbrB/MazE/SpoVT family DNA-binding domain-containing protein n=1 Tax=Natrinema salsiterrestre TaxID=2950540 RepID=A0A9Q4Q1Y9_9EURY|nr:AbrB/MazE/SpoVT family DNA-binding domain-containing protein [Natrinema salsiterrestre]MDF9746011.1 AbrB/MazE/SpoVT family DNA-binding domain-containing protein [Natrinema salsiterrestre]
MGNIAHRPGRNESAGEEVTLTVDGHGRVTLPKGVRERLGIEPNDRISATLIGSVLEITPKPRSELQTATAERGEWANSTPIDAGEALFGSMDSDETTE